MYKIDDRVSEPKKPKWRTTAMWLVLVMAVAAFGFTIVYEPGIVFGIRLLLQLSAVAIFAVIGFVLGVSLLRDSQGRWLGTAVILFTVLCVGGIGALSWLRIDRLYERDHAVSQARVTIVNAHRMENLQHWSLGLNDAAIAASAAKLLHDLGGEPLPSQVATWTNLTCATLRERCPVSSTCMIGFNSAWSAVQGQPWEDNTNSFLRKSPNGAWVRAGHEPRADGETICLADFGLAH